jgi:hypothetical protein
MIPEKFYTLLEKIYLKTNEGSLKWKPTVEENTFEIKLNSGTFSIMKSGDDYLIQILNADGVVIDYYWNKEIDGKILGDNSHTVLTSLYTLARSKALGLDKTIDAMLKNLNDMDNLL